MLLCGCPRLRLAVQGVVVQGLLCLQAWRSCLWPWRRCCGGVQLFSCCRCLPLCVLAAMHAALRLCLCACRCACMPLCMCTDHARCCLFSSPWMVTNSCCHRTAGSNATKHSSSINTTQCIECMRVLHKTYAHVSSVHHPARWPCAAIVSNTESSKKPKLQARSSKGLSAAVR